MSWAEKLYHTYQLCESEIGNDEQHKMLLPMFHLTQRAQIEVVLNEDGEFITATAVEPEDAVTVMPVTEDSACRSSGIAPHPLHDKLVYLDKNYATYANKNNEDYVNKYLENLHAWAISSSSHRTIQSVYAYLLKGELINDLIACHVLSVVDGTFDKKKFQKTIAQGDALVRFYVQSSLLSNSNQLDRPWKDKSLYESYIQFEKARHQEVDTCYLSGKQVYCTEKHPVKIRHSGDKAKLISSNDSLGFTFRGRFANKKDAISMGYETSQMIHNALRWLITKQGYRSDDMTVLVWNENVKSIPNGLEDFDIEDDVIVDTEIEYARKINNQMRGYEEQVEAYKDIMIMELEAATEGRLSITYYQELAASDYFSNMKQWYTYCNWNFYTKQGKHIHTPIPKTIVKTAFGTLRKEGMVADEKVISMHLRHLLPCIYSGKRIPKDIIHALYYQTFTLSKLDRKQWIRGIGILCSLLKKDLYDQNKANGRMVTWSIMEEENKKNKLESPAYVCGKLLAIYDAIEGYDLYLQEGKHSNKDFNDIRSTNAMKLYSQYQQYPMRTLMIIDKLVHPYVVRLGSRANHYLRIKEEITRQLYNMTDLSKLRNLNYDFAMGFDAQRLALEEKRQEKAKNKSSNEEESKDE